MLFWGFHFNERKPTLHINLDISIFIMELFARDGSSETGLVLPHVFKGFIQKMKSLLQNFFQFLHWPLYYLLQFCCLLNYPLPLNKSLYLHLHLIRIYLFVNALLDRLKSRKGFHKIAQYIHISIHFSNITSLTLSLRTMIRALY